MKRLITILIIPLFVFMLLSTVSAHSGRTDYKGGHYNHSTGEYHYHHGYPEHQHINGECPYQDEEKEKQEILEKKQENYYEKVLIILTILLSVLFFIIIFNAQ